MTSGPMTRVWFSNGYISMDGSVHFISATPPPNTDTRGITTGPDGNLWFVTAPGQTTPETITKLTPSGATTTYAVSGNCYPGGITTGSDRALWIDQEGCGIARITTRDLYALSSCWYRKSRSHHRRSGRCRMVCVVLQQ